MTEYTEEDFEPVGTAPEVGDTTFLHDDDGTFVDPYIIREIDGTALIDMTGQKRNSVDFVARSGVRRILKRQKTEDSPEKAGKTDEKQPKTILNDAISRLGLKNAEYPVEDSFSFIARRWNVWMENRGESFRFSACDVASLMVDFKRGRKEARMASGMTKRDDRIDECGYIHHEDRMLEDDS